MTDHRATPYEIDDNFIASAPNVAAKNWDQAWVCQWGSYCEIETAEFIVTACNNHDKLVAALEAAISEDMVMDKWVAVIREARAVLAAVKGE